MDCEKFDRVVLDLLYDELDVLTEAAALRHTEHCTRCRRISSELRATREVGSVPLLPPPDSLQARILDNERQANSGLSLGRRLGRWISITASYAMRPQLGMAALLLLMIGGSLLLLRTRPGERDPAQLSARGAAEPEVEAPRTPPLQSALPAASPPPAAPPAAEQGAIEKAPAAAASAPPADVAPESADELAGRPSFDAALEDFEARRYAAARSQFDRIAKLGGPDAALAALRGAEAWRWSNGCAAAAPRFDDVTARFGATHPSIAQHATWHAAECYRSLGQLDQARQRYQALLASGTYGRRAEGALASLSGSEAAASGQAGAKP